MATEKTCRGLTLTELLLVLALVALLAMLAAPAFNRLLQANRVRTEVSRLMVAINLVRSEALRRNVPVTMCPSPLAATGEAVCSGIYAGGWMIFSDVDRNRELDGRDRLIRSFAGLPRGFTLTNRAGTRNADEPITYLPDGTSGRNRTLLVCAPPGAAVASRSVVMNIVGRPRVTEQWGTCPAG
jgi:prepilin-type N-terminal cleavage/methylation domain-containing protein